MTSKGRLELHLMTCNNKSQSELWREEETGRGQEEGGAEVVRPVLNRLGHILLPRSLPRSSALLAIARLQRASASTLLPVEAIHSPCLLLLVSYSTIVCSWHSALQLRCKATILSIIGLLS